MRTGDGRNHGTLQGEVPVRIYIKTTHAIPDIL